MDIGTTAVPREVELWQNLFILVFFVENKRGNLKRGKNKMLEKNL